MWWNISFISTPHSSFTMVHLFDHHFDLHSQKHHPSGHNHFHLHLHHHFIISGADVCIVESTFCFTMFGPSCLSFHKITLYQMHLDGINILPYKFVATITTQTMYFHYLGNLNMLLRNLEKLW
jgi:hypothetical protein